MGNGEISEMGYEKNEKYDVVVVGAGTGGCLAAKTVADAGLTVCLIDRKRKEDVGEKICGDAVGKHHFDNLKLAYPTGKELERKMVGVRIYSPDMGTVFDVKGEGLEGFIVNRQLFGQRLLKSAIDAGATFFEQTQAVEPLLKDGFVHGVLTKNLKTERKVTFFGQAVIDASGYSAVLRKKLPTEIGIETNVNEEDVELCYREIRELKTEVDNPDFCEIYLNQKIAPGGYAWIFPEGGTKVNVGLGVTMSKGFPNPKNQLYENVLSLPLFEDSSVVNAGTWYDPTRRPIDCMVGNGILIVGDAACQVNPIHGGGIGPSMTGGFLAGETVIEALKNGDVAQERLWPYNVKYIRSYGTKQAGLDVFRMFLQGIISDDDLNYGMRYQLITEEDLLKAALGGEARLNITETTVRIFRGLGRLRLLKRLRDSANLMRRVRQHYRNYPTSPKELDEWKAKTRLLIEEASRWRKAK